MAQHEGDLPDAKPLREFGSLRGLIHMSDDFDEPMSLEPASMDRNREVDRASAGTVTPMLEKAIRAARELPEADQDALAANILEWIEDERRWAASFARTQEALLELAREAQTEHHAGQTLDSAYAEMGRDAAREAEAAEWSDALLSDAADEDEERRPAAEE